MTEDRLSQEALDEIRRLAAENARKITEAGDIGGFVSDLYGQDAVKRVTATDARGRKVYVKTNVTPSEQ